MGGIDIMAKYLQNNQNMIKMYSALYKDEMNIDSVIERLFEGDFDSIPMSNFCRFRVFLDACLLLFNKEKLEEEYFKGAFKYGDFIDALLDDDDKNQFVDCCEEMVSEHCSMNIDIKKSKRFYYSTSSSKVETVYNQLKILRNSFAHMQYGEFVLMGSKGRMAFYGIYNKDIDKNEAGVVIEPIIHEFIRAFFSNNTNKGIPYKHTFLLPNVNKEGEMKMFLGEVRYIGSTQAVYGGFENHVMKSKVFSEQNQKDKLMAFLREHEDELRYEEQEITVEKINEFECLGAKTLNRRTSLDELAYMIKAFYDIETEFSNFLVHLIQLNDRIINYKEAMRYKCEENLEKVVKSLKQLQEDVTSWSVFRYFFVLLDCINTIFRLEDDDLSKVDVGLLNIEGFEYDDKKMVAYVNRVLLEGTLLTEKAQFGDKYYVIGRFRNALAHGNICLRLDSKKGVMVRLLDKHRWSGREEKMEIQIDDMVRFLSRNSWRLDE